MRPRPVTPTRKAAPLVIFNLAIGNRVHELHYYQDSDPQALAQQFVARHGLPDSKLPAIQALIDQHLRAYWQRKSPLRTRSPLRPPEPPREDFEKAHLRRIKKLFQTLD
jgi:hypothetical protein